MTPETPRGAFISPHSVTLWPFNRPIDSSAIPFQSQSTNPHRMFRDHLRECQSAQWYCRWRIRFREMVSRFSGPPQYAGLERGDSGNIQGE